MNKMAELRTQMESLSMLKKTKRRISKKSTRPKSGKRSSRPGSRGQSRNNPGSRMSTWSASTNGSSVIYKKKLKEAKDILKTVKNKLLEMKEEELENSSLAQAWLAKSQL